MKKTLLISVTTLFWQLFAYAQTWEWAHAEPNGPAVYTGEDDAAHHVKTDANGNVYVLGSFLGYLYLSDDIVTQGNGSYLAKYDPTGALLWYKLIVPDYGNTAGDTYIKASDLVVNNSGVYITGRYNYSLGYRDIFANCNTVVTALKAYKISDYSFTSSIYDIGLFVAKLTTDGDVVWNKIATDSYTDEHNCLQPATCGNCGSAADFPVLTSDPNNNLTVAFTYSPGFNFGASGLIFDGTTISSARTSNNGGRDLIFINVNSDGNYRWSNTAFTNPYFLNNNIAGIELECNSVVADNNGSIFITGQAGDHAAFGTDVVATTPAGESLRYIAKLSSSGSWVFEKTLTKYSSVSSLGSVAVYGMDANPNLLTVDADNNVYALVNLASAAGSPQYILGIQVDPNPSQNSMYLLKMNNNGDPDWVNKFGSTPFGGSQFGLGIQYANNDLYITGAMATGTSGLSNYQFSNLFVPSASTTSNLEYLLARADISGNFKWATTFSGFQVGGFSIAVSEDNIYTGGFYRRQIYSLGNFNVDRSTTTDITTSEIFFGKLKDQYIHVGAVTPTTVCPGATFTIPFTSFGLTLSNTNTFTAQLSDANGDFTNATNIGSVVSTGSGSITATLLANLPMGSTGYRVRIASSDLLPTGLPYYAYADVNYVLTIGSQAFYQDADGDSYGNPAVSLQTCNPPAGYVLDNTDCNDNDNTLHSPITYYRDADSDGFGDLNTTTAVCESIPPQGYVDNSSDCDDTQKLYSDNDGDGYGRNTLVACDGVQNNTDCNDGNVNINPGAVEVCGNGVDDNCNGQIDEGCSVSPPSISINDVTVYESQGTATITVSLSKTSTQAIKINYTTMDGTAVGKGKGKNPAIDFVAAKGTLTIPAGSLTGTIDVTIINDGIAEQDEYFDVVLSVMKKANATISDGSGRITISQGSPITQARATMIQEKKVPTGDFLIKSLSNPTVNSFTVTLNSNNWNEKIMLRIIDITGRVIETRNNIVAGQTLKIGWNYRPGIYLVEAIQGKERKILKLLKQ